MAVNTGYDDTGLFKLFNDEPSIPDANELLSLKILKDANPGAFQNLAAEETKWLALSLGLLRRDVYLQMMLGGKGVRQAMKLSGILKKKSEMAHFNHRINGVVDRMVTTKFMDNGWGGLKPVDTTDINEFLKYDNDKKAVQIKPMASAGFVYGTPKEEFGFKFDASIPTMTSHLGDG